MRLGVDDGPAALRQGGFLEAAIKLLGECPSQRDTRERAQDEQLKIAYRDKLV